MSNEIIQQFNETVTLNRYNYDSMVHKLEDLAAFRAKVEESTGSDFDSFCYSKDFNGRIYWLKKDEGIKHLESELKQAQQAAFNHKEALQNYKKRGFWKRVFNAD